LELFMHDPFEESLRDLMKSSPPEHDDDACLGRVLKTASRQVGVGDFLSLMGHWAGALMIAINVSPTSRATPSVRITDKAD
jgi:hypothetical protein